MRQIFRVIVKRDVKSILAENNSIHSITFYFADITGKIYFTKTLQKNTNFTFDKNKYVPGVYFINYNTGYKNVNNKILIN